MTALSLDEYPLRNRVFDLLNESTSPDSCLYYLSADDLADWLLRYAGDKWEGDDEELRILRGVSAIEMLPFCAEWLEKWLAERMEERMEEAEE